MIKMKKVVIALVLGLLLFSLPSYLYAQEETPTPDETIEASVIAIQ